MSRQAEFERNTKETKMKAVVNIDGKGEGKIKTQVSFLDHMLDLFTFHGFFDLDLNVSFGDTDIDIHHTNEDIGIVLGKTFKKALDEKQGIKRFGVGFSPMEFTTGRTVVDVSGRGYFTLNVEGDLPEGVDDGLAYLKAQSQEGYNFAYLEHFLESFAHNLGATITVTIQNPSDDMHTNIETVFKSFGIALDVATTVDPRRGTDVPSTKGIID